MSHKCQNMTLKWEAKTQVWKGGGGCGRGIIVPCSKLEHSRGAVGQAGRLPRENCARREKAD